MDELVKAIPSLLGVLIGGLITFFVQNTTVRKQQKWDREKIKWDRQYQEQTLKFQTYNKILQLNRTHMILEWDMHKGSELNRIKYITHIRPLLFEVFHLLDEGIAERMNFIEDVYERQFVVEVEEPGDKDGLIFNYQSIIKIINAEFNLLRKVRVLKYPEDAE